MNESTCLIRLWDGEMATPFLIYKTQEKEMTLSKEVGKERRMATCILTMLPYGDGEMSTSILLIALENSFRRRQKERERERWRPSS